MKEKIIALLQKKYNPLHFSPAIEVMTDTDVLYICGLFSTRFKGQNTRYFAVVEMQYDNEVKPLADLSDEVLEAIYLRLRGIVSVDLEKMR